MIRWLTSSRTSNLKHDKHNEKGRRSEREDRDEIYNGSTAYAYVHSPMEFTISFFLIGREETLNTGVDMVALPM